MSGRFSLGPTRNWRAIEMAFQVIPIPGTGLSSNCYLVLDDHPILIDSGCDERITQTIRKLGISPESVRMIINTHCHFDHVLCNELFTEAKVCMRGRPAD
jgi:hydroxyacylglutathione hydrolase